MVRPLRIVCPEAIYHIVARGNNRQSLFLDAGDFKKYLALLADATKRYSITLHAYALMPNHVHLMVQPGQSYPVSKLMQSVQTRYAMHFNARYDRVGHAFQGRYKSILVERESYALELGRYIHLNPVRAGLVRYPEDYEWSSYRAYLGEPNPMVKVGLVADLAARNAADAKQAIEKFTREGLRRSWDLEREVVEGRFLGSRTFVASFLGASHAQAGAARVRPFI